MNEQNIEKLRLIETLKNDLNVYINKEKVGVLGDDEIATKQYLEKRIYELEHPDEIQTHKTFSGRWFVLRNAEFDVLKNALNSEDVEDCIEVADFLPAFFCFATHVALILIRLFGFYSCSYVSYAISLALSEILGIILSYYMRIYRWEWFKFLVNAYILTNDFNLIFIKSGFILILFSSKFLLGSYLFAVIYYVIKLGISLLYYKISNGHCRLNGEIVLLMSRYW